MSCGDNIIEGGKSGPAGSDLKGTINVHVRNGAGDKAFTSASDSVYVTLIDAGTRPQLLGANGSVNFTNLTEGSYEIRVEKTGYATAYYTAKILQDDVTGTTGKVVNIPAVLYKLDGTLTGSLRYQKADGSSGFADGSIVRLEVGVNRTTDVLNAEDIKIEQRVHEATVTGGKYTLTGVPAVPGIYYKLTALGFSAGGVEFADKVLFNKDGPDIASGATSTASTKVATDVVDQLTVISISPFVTGVSPIEITFNVQPENLGSSTSLIFASGVPVTVSYDASKILLTPAYPWKDAGVGNIEVRLTDLRSKSGALLPKDTANINRWSGLVAVQDIVREKIVITNLESDGRIWIRDSAEAIVLEFNKDIDTGKLAQTSFLTPNGKTEIVGNKITISPPEGKWSNPKNLVINETNIRTLVATDGATFATQAEFTLKNWTVGWGELILDPFVLLRTDTTLATLDLTGTVHLRFSLDIDTSSKPEIKIIRGVGANAYTAVGSPCPAPPATPTADLDCQWSLVSEVPTISISGKTISITPGYDWTEGSGNRNAIVVKNLTAADGQKKNTALTDVIYYVTRIEGGAFQIIESQVTTTIKSVSDTLRIIFSEPVDTTSWVKNDISITPNQPFEVIFEKGGSVVALKPLSSFGWTRATPPMTAPAPTDAMIKVTFNQDLSSLGGKKLGGAGSSKYFKTTGGGGTLTNADVVTWFAFDSSITVNGDIAVKGDASIKLAWRTLTNTDIDGYRLWWYSDKTDTASAVVELTTANILSKTGIGHVGLDGKTKPTATPFALGDTLTYSLDFTPVLDGNLYSVVVVPYQSSGAVGKETVISIKTAFTFKQGTSQTRDQSREGAATGAATGGWVKGNYGSDESYFTVDPQNLSTGKTLRTLVADASGLSAASALGSFTIDFSDEIDPASLPTNLIPVNVRSTSTDADKAGAALRVRVERTIGGGPEDAKQLTVSLYGIAVDSDPTTSGVQPTSFTWTPGAADQLDFVIPAFKSTGGTSFSDIYTKSDGTKDLPTKISVQIK
jgi:hypothetical protein